MITERTETVYAVTCDNCGARADWGLSEKEARDLAQEAGWYHKQRFNGLEYVSRDLCPQCYAALSDPQGGGYHAKTVQGGAG